jgi:DNA polymerase-3 subunit epsilon
MAAALEATGDYRVLRRLQPRSVVTPLPPGTKTWLGIMLDTETTGLDPARDEIIELAMLPFIYGRDGTIYDIREPFQGLREPSKPIPPEVTALTGITDEMVAGHSIDPDEVAAFAAPASLVIAHNAGFDRRFMERFSDVFTTKAWACSQTQVPWAEEGFEGTKLGYLLAGCGFFHGAHRAVDDCRAAVEILAHPLPKSGAPAMSKLLEAARTATCRVWADGAPFGLKDALKARGYKWNDGSDGRLKAWFTDVVDGKLDAELAYLRAEIYQREVDVPVTRIEAYDRFSERV